MTLDLLTKEDLEKLKQTLISTLHASEISFDDIELSATEENVVISFIVKEKKILQINKENCVGFEASTIAQSLVELLAGKG